jgi:hypothetical protein
MQHLYPIPIRLSLSDFRLSYCSIHSSRGTSVPLETPGLQYLVRRSSTQRSAQESADSELLRTRSVLPDRSSDRYFGTAVASGDR